MNTSPRLTEAQLLELAASAPADTKFVVIDPLSKLLPGDVLHELADTAFTVMNWARRVGFNRERQIEEVRKAFEVTLGYRKPVKSPEEVSP